MSLISIFYSTFTQEKEIREQLELVSGYKVIQDDDVINEVCRKYDVGREKVERALTGPTSVFNKFTLERERMTALLKVAVADHLQGSGVIFSGYISLLIPSAVTHVLKVGIFDERSNRIHRAVAEGLGEKSAVKLIKKHDLGANDWSDYVLQKTANDASLYDIVIPIGSSSPESAVQLIMENLNKPAVLENETSRQAVADMVIGARAELALVEKGYTPQVKVNNGNVSLFVNKSVLNFSKLTNTLTEIVGAVDGIESVEVVPGKDYHVSVYRDMEFSLPPKVLLVDDEQEFILTLSERLNTRDYGSYPVFDGEKALELLESGETPDVMVLDLKMPDMDGVEVLRKTKEANADIEIIILTGYGSEEDERTCKELGAFAYLYKPVDIAELTATIDEAHKKVAAARMAHT